MQLILSHEHASSDKQAVSHFPSITQPAPVGQKWASNRCQCMRHENHAWRMQQRQLHVVSAVFPATSACPSVLVNCTKSHHKRHSPGAHTCDTPLHSPPFPSPCSPIHPTYPPVVCVPLRWPPPPRQPRGAASRRALSSRWHRAHTCTSCTTHHTRHKAVAASRLIVIDCAT